MMQDDENDNFNKMEPLFNDLGSFHNKHAQNNTGSFSRADLIVHDESVHARMLHHQRLLYLQHAKDPSFGNFSKLAEKLPAFETGTDFCNKEFVKTVCKTYSKWPLCKSSTVFAKPCDFNKNNTDAAPLTFTSIDLNYVAHEKECAPEKSILNKWKSAIGKALKRDTSSSKWPNCSNLSPLPEQDFDMLQNWQPFVFEVRNGYLFLYAVAVPDANSPVSRTERRSSVQSIHSRRSLSSEVSRSAANLKKKWVSAWFSGFAPKKKTPKVHLVYYAPIKFTAGSALGRITERTSAAGDQNNGKAHRPGAPLDLDVYDDAQIQFLLSILVPGKGQSRVDHWLMDFSAAWQEPASDTASVKSLATLKQQRKELVGFVECLREGAQCPLFIASPQFANDDALAQGNWLKHVPDRVYSIAKPLASPTSVAPLQTDAVLARPPGKPTTPAIRRMKSLSASFAQLQAQFNTTKRSSVESPSVIAVDTFHSLYTNLVLAKNRVGKRPSSVAEVSRAVVAKMAPLSRTLSHPTRRQGPRIYSSLLDRTPVSRSNAQSLHRSVSLTSSGRNKSIKDDLDCVPKVLVKLVNLVEASGLQTEGLYRLSGNSRTVQNLKASLIQSPAVYEQDGPAIPAKLLRSSRHVRSLSDGMSQVNAGEDMETLSALGQDVHVLASCIKAFFREGFPPLGSDSSASLEPWTVGASYEQFVSAAQLADYSERMLRIQDLVHSLPDMPFYTLKFFCGHLQRVAAKESCNRMSTTNLALIFGPTLIKPPALHDSIAKLMQDMPFLCQIAEVMIEHVGWVFGPIEFEDASLSSSYAPSDSPLHAISRASFASQSSQTANNISTSDITLALRQDDNVFAIPKRESSLSEAANFIYSSVIKV